MPRLLDRSRQIPGSLRFLQPETKFETPLWSSFDTIVDMVLQHRRGNHYLAQKNKWALDRTSIAEEVDAYNAALCKAHGWNNYISEGGDDPKSNLSLLRSASHLAAGGRAIADWLGDGGVPVAAVESESRAVVCADCPKNGKGDWTRFFTVPAANHIRRQMAIRNDMAVSTPWDDELGVCEACDCPLTLKVHSPIQHILKHLTAEVRSALDPRCWILKAK